MLGLRITQWMDIRVRTPWTYWDSHINHIREKWKYGQNHVFGQKPLTITVGASGPIRRGLIEASAFAPKPQYEVF